MSRDAIATLEVEKVRPQRTSMIKRSLFAAVLIAVSAIPARADLADTLQEMQETISTIQRQWLYIGKSKKGEDIYLRTNTLTPDRNTNQVGFHYRIGEDTVLAIASCSTSLMTVGQVNGVSQNLKDPRNRFTPNRGSATDKMVKTACFRAFD
jgi:hypothetical protein